MSSQTKGAIFSLVALAVLGTFSYSRFSNFKPKNLQPLEEVHGARTSAATTIEDVPFPQDYVLLGSAKTEHTSQITFETNAPAQDVQNFYRNVFMAKGWEVEYDGRSDTSFTTGYKLERQNIKVVSSAQENSGKSIVSVEMSN